MGGAMGGAMGALPPHAAAPHAARALEMSDCSSRF